jgi:TRAP-type transport system periplasmic protein
MTTKNTTNVIPKAELENWKKLSQPLFDSWVSDMNGKGQNGKQMLDGAKALIAKHAGGK